MMNPGHQLCIGNASKCSRIGSLKKQSSVFISQNKGLLALATLCSSFVIILCYSHVGVMTFFGRRGVEFEKFVHFLFIIYFESLTLPFQPFFFFPFFKIFFFFL